MNVADKYIDYYFTEGSRLVPDFSANMVKRYIRSNIKVEEETRKRLLSDPKEDVKLTARINWIDYHVGMSSRITHQASILWRHYYDHEKESISQTILSALDTEEDNLYINGFEVQISEAVKETLKPDITSDVRFKVEEAAQKIYPKVDWLTLRDGQEV